VALTLLQFLKGFIVDHNLFIDTQYALCLDDDWRDGFLYGAIRTDANGAFVHMYSTLPDVMRHERHVRRARAEVFHHQWLRARADKIAALKNRIRSNLLPRASRWHGIRYEDFPKLRRLLQDFSVAKQDGDATTLAKLLSEMSNYINSIFANNLYDRQLSSDFDLFRCTDCGEWFDNDQSHNTEDGVVCECCRENYLWSDCMGIYIASDDSRSVYSSYSRWESGDSCDCCTERYGNDNFYEYDNCYFHEEYDRDRASGDYWDDEDEDCYDYQAERREAEAYLPSYHGVYRIFVEQNASLKYPALGVELEVYSPERREFVEDMRDEFGSDFDKIIMERDGSLNHEHGVEIITQPMGREEWLFFAPQLLNKVQEHACVGFNDPAGAGYGIHVSIHRRHFSPLAEARIAMFMAATPNKQFVQAIAQRDQIYGVNNGFGMGAFEKPAMKNVSSENRFYANRSGAGRTQKKMVGRGKYCPVNWRDNLAEFRIFQSTTNIDTFMKNLEFVWALHAWTKPETASGCMYDHREFLAWLNTPEQRHQFPFLTEFLSKKVFYGTNYPPIISSWHSRMVKPVDLEAIESMAA
jgi:hypothetical protein